MSRKSVDAYCYKFALINDHKNTGVSAYRTVKQKSIAKSADEKETLCICSAANQAIYMRKLMEEIFPKKKTNITILNDNTSAVEICKHPTNYNQSSNLISM